jgi:FkbM family methyltransferase
MVTTAVSTAPLLPWYFHVARAVFSLLSGHRGQYALYGLLRRLGLLEGSGQFRFFDSHIHIPLTVPETLFIWDYSLFHGLREINFATVIHRELGPSVTLIDCGAAFGQISCRLTRLAPSIRSVVAIEPNADHLEVLGRNLALLNPVRTRLLQCAVSNFAGRGELVYPNGRADRHSAFVRPSDGGEIDVIRIDDLAEDFDNTDLVLKLDVEGGELAAIEGAAATLRAARRVCLFIELHPTVLQRVGHQAEQILQAVNRIRPARWTLADKPYVEIDPWRPVFEQTGQRVIDVVGVCEPS